MTSKDIDIQILINIARKAGNAILKVYESPIEIERKDDNTPLTLADKRANDVILEMLQETYPDIPFISEESIHTPYEIRKDWPMYWLIDPLDGTKEFIKRNGEFTVNIALIEAGEPVIGVIYVPVKEACYYAIRGSGSYIMDRNGKHRRLEAALPDDRLLVVGSRSHVPQDVQDFINKQKKKYSNVELLSAGSSLKFCMVAEGKAHVYPRLGPTMEWDIAAGQIIATEAGATMLTYPDLKQMRYNKEDLLNPDFIVGRNIF